MQNNSAVNVTSMKHSVDCNAENLVCKYPIQAHIDVIPSDIPARMRMDVLDREKIVAEKSSTGS
eukprot:IDg3162t1